MNENFPKIYRTTRGKLKTPDAFWDVVYEDPKIREEIKNKVLDDISSGDPKRMSWNDLPLYKNGEKIAFINAMNIPVPDRPLMISLVWDVTETRQRDIQYNSIIQATQDAFWYTDMQGNLLDVNDAACKLLGYNRKEMLKMRISDIDVIEDIEAAATHIQKVKNFGKDLFETKQRHKNGTIIEVEVSSSYFNFAGGRLVIFIRDITERKKIEERLKQAYQIINESHIVAFIWKNEENWPVTFVSENIKLLWGYPVDDFITGKVPYSSIVYPDDLERVENEVLAASNNRSVKSFEHQPYRIITLDGRILWVSDKTEIIRDNNGNIVQYQGIIEDFTDKKLADESIHSYVLKLDYITSNIGSGILMENEEHKIEFVNPSLLKIFSVEASPEEIIGTDLSLAAKYLKSTFKEPEEFLKSMGKIKKQVKKL
jgi:PAS domain S-box-containing protein